MNSLLEPIDKLLNKVTMYRLILYYLIALLILAFIFSLFHLLSFNPLALLISTAFLIGASWISNSLLSDFFQVPVNIESYLITALILTLIVNPVNSVSGLITLLFFSLIAMASKFVINLKNKHIFNPAALSVWLVGLILGQYATWWVGTTVMLPAVLIGGFLVMRKIQREDLVISFLLAVTITSLFLSSLGGSSFSTSLQKLITETPLFYFAFVMLTEPLTTPPTRGLRTYYGILVGILFTPQLSILGMRTTPESALLLGNLFSYIVSPKVREILKLKDKIQVASNIYDFIYKPTTKFNFLPGQYMEWTLPHQKPDSRGNRRYFTLASSPTEHDVIIGVRINSNASSFKKSLEKVEENNQIVAGQIAGDFVLPKDQHQKLVFIAGGIGVTPFRSMVKYLIDKDQKRDLVILYTAKNADGFAYKNIFDEAHHKIGTKVVYTLTSKVDIPSNWPGRIGRINHEFIKEEVPDFNDRTFYISGPNSMVKDFEEMLQKIGVKNANIVTDFFPGF